MTEERKSIIWKLAAWCIGIIAVMLVISLWGNSRLPADAKIPVHWNAAGQIDRYGSRLEGLYVLPIVAAVTAILLAVLPLFEPRRANIIRSSNAYVAISASVLILLAFLHAGLVLNAIGRPVSIPRIACGGTAVVFLVIGSVVGGIKSNFLCGIRTPWTLSSELSWQKTHRLGGRLFLALGIVILVSSALLRESWLLGLLLGGLVIVTVIATAYSYVIWKQDPNRSNQAR